jgi:copper homeostasis protein (lipoprotein)
MRRLALPLLAATFTALSPTGTAAPIQAPAAFVGDLPCADCPGIRHTLELRGDGTYFLRQQHLVKGPTAVRDSIGRWRASAYERTLLLHSGRSTADVYGIQDADTLRLRDRRGNEIPTAQNLDLNRDDTAEPLGPRTMMVGMHSRMAHSALFTERATGLPMPVAMEGDNVTLDRAYADARTAANAPVAMQLEGRLARKPRMAGEGTQLVLIPERFVKSRPGYRCSTPTKPVTMIDTEWALVRLAGEPVVPPENRRAPTLRLMADGKLAGYDGCNRLAGSYTQDGAQLAFGALASTRMACPPWADIERRFAHALAATTGSRLVGPHFELLDADGKVLARFDARPRSSADLK